jgi:hypothetical protein
MLGFIIGFVVGFGGGLGWMYRGAIADYFRARGKGDLK